MLEYRKRCFEAYGSTAWRFTHSLSKYEYELFSKMCSRRFRNILPQDMSASIIDIACGSGHFLYFLQKQGYKNIRGIDLSRQQLDAARKIGVTNLEQANLFSYLPKHPAEYDIIVANDVIEHLLKDEALNMLDLVYASLKPGGIVIMSTLNSSSLFASSIRYIDFTHELGFTPESLRQAMSVCKFTDVRISGESPVIYDLRSAIRSLLWFLLKIPLKGYLIIARGTGRNCWKIEDVLEERMFAVGYKRAG